MNKAHEHILEQVSVYMHTLIKNGENKTYDTKHLELVDYYSQKLAKHRDLDVFTARCTALLHDVGRIQYPQSLKGHGKRGAIIARQLLEDYGVEEDRINHITDAIEYHTKKKKIHHDYRELIKDADALAHWEEGDLDQYEIVRVKHAFREEFQCEWVHDFDYSQAYEALIKKLSGLLSSLSDLSNSPSLHECIHDIRVTIRKIRALSWLVINSGQEVNYRQIQALEKGLIKIFKSLEKPRELYVLSKSLADRVNKKEAAILNKKLRKAIKKVQKMYGGYLLEEVLHQEIEDLRKILLSFSTDHISSDYIRQDYCLALKNAKVKEGETLHQLRIEGKRLKYLHSIGCVSFDKKIHAQIIELHDLLGDFHDVEVNQRWVHKWDFDNKVFKFLTVQKEIKLREIKPLLFELKIITKIT